MSLNPTPGWIVRRTVMTVLFWIFALSILLYMAGLRVNWQAKTVRATSSIYLHLAGKAKEPVEYIINGQSFTGTTPITIGQLTPGAYSITVRQPEHIEWHRSVRLDAGEAANFTDILLLPTIISSREPVESELKLLDSTLIVADEDLRLTGGELYLTNSEDNEDLLLRLSENISQAIWLPDAAHLLLLVGETVAVVEKSGTNMTPLFTVPAGVSSQLYVSKDGATVLVKSGDVVLAYDIAELPGPFWTHL